MGAKTPSVSRSRSVAAWQKRYAGMLALGDVLIEDCEIFRQR
jgi:hypothetical protein